MASRSKQKGSAWERDICKILGDHLGGNFMRVPNSGAFIGGVNSKRKAVMSEGQVKLLKGDIITPDHLPHIEAKNYGEFQFHQLWQDNGSKLLNSWIDQVKTTVDPDDIWFVIMKITRRGSWIVFDQQYMNEFDIPSYLVYTAEGKKYVITDLANFVNRNSPKLLTLCGPKITV